MKIIVHRTELAELESAMGREWLETNGIGGYASGTVANCHSRKYHGLLVAQLRQPSGRFVLLSQIEDWLEVQGQSFPLVTHQYGETFHPEGHLRSERFEATPRPTFVYRCGELTVTRRIQMLDGQDAVLVQYELSGDDGEVTLCLRPLLAFRDIHEVTRANAVLDPRCEPAENGFSVQPYRGMPRLWFQTSTEAVFCAEPLWFYNVSYQRDAERGFDHQEDLFAPAVLRLRLLPNEPVILSASLSPLPTPLDRVWETEETRRRRDQAEVQQVARAAALRHHRHRELLVALVTAARRHLIRLPGTGPAVHAGYHWFGPWGRDTLIALPGVAFLTGNLKLGAEILRAAAAMESRGLVPNFVNPDGTGAYTAADPALWFFWTVQQYLAAGGAKETVRRDFWPSMLSVLRHYRAGTDNRIITDADGLLRAGIPGVAVTWMDAQIGGRPVVPRWGYMVELNALWYNALCFALELAQEFDEYVEELDSAYCAKIQGAFQRRFWATESQTLLDTVNEYFVEACVRPNQILAVSLPHSPLSEEQQRSVVNAVKQDLLTPCGLRSLAAQDVRYRATCEGHHGVRDLAYHQGSVWPWLLPHFAEAYFRAYGRNREVLELFDPVVAAIEAHLREAGLGSISEIFDGDPPHTPRGAISQAWNLGEVIRLLLLLGDLDRSQGTQS